MTADVQLGYDPYDPVLNRDPYPAFRRLREEAPLWYHEQHNFYTLARHADVEQGLRDWQTFISGKGGIIEIIQADIDLPPGTLIFEDPPIHDIHRGLLSRVFTPRKMAALEDKVREFCTRCLDPLAGAGRFDLIGDLGAIMPMWTIGMLLGIPESDQAAIRDRSNDNLHTEPGEKMDVEGGLHLGSELFADYVDWRREHPSDDLMTELLNAEFEDETGTVRTLTRDEVLTYVMVIAGAGNETTTRLIGWAGVTLAAHPDQRAELAADRSLLKGAIEELLRYEPPAPHIARAVSRDVEYYGRTVPAGSVMLFLVGSANRDGRQFPDGDRFDIHRNPAGHLGFGYGIHYCLGAALARLEGRVALDELLTRFPTWEVDTDAAKLSSTTTVRGWESLPIVTG